MQDNSDSRNDFVAGERETEDCSSSSSDDDEKFVDCESISFGDLEDNLEGRQALYDVRLEWEKTT